MPNLATATAGKAVAPHQRFTFDGALAGESLAFEARLFAGTHRLNWSLAPFKKRGDEGTNVERAMRIEATLTRYGDGVREWYAPVPTDFNGEVVRGSDLKAKLAFGRLRIHRGAQADAVVLPLQAGFLLSASGCLSLVASDGITCVAAHAGLRSMLRWGKEADTPHESVIYQVAREFSDPKRATVWLFFSIRPDRLLYPANHEAYGPENRALHDLMRKRGYREALTSVGGIHMPVLAGLQIAETGMTLSPPGMHAYLKEDVPDTRSSPPYNTHRSLIAITRMR